jgi:hypothetical protein
MVTIMDALGATSNVTFTVPVTRQHKLFMDYIVTVEALNTKLLSTTTTSALIVAAMEHIFFYRAMLNLQQDTDDILPSL